MWMCIRKKTLRLGGSWNEHSKAIALISTELSRGLTYKDIQGSGDGLGYGYQKRGHIEILLAIS